MADEIKVDSGEVKPVENTTFSVSINAPNDKVFTFSGPVESSGPEREIVAYRLLQEYIVINWRDAMIKANNEKKEEDNANIEKQ